MQPPSADNMAFEFVLIRYDYFNFIGIFKCLGLKKTMVHSTKEIF